MKTSIIVKGGIALSAICAAVLSIDNAKLAKKNRQLESELADAKTQAEAVPVPVDIPVPARVYDDAEDEFEARLESVNNRLLALAERKLEAAERKEAAKAAKAQAKAERKLAKAEAKAAKSAKA